MVGIYGSDPICRTNFVSLVSTDNANHTCRRELRPGLQVCFSTASSHGHVVRLASLLPFFSLTHYSLLDVCKKRGGERPHLR